MSRTETLPIRKLQSIGDELDKLHSRVMQRAYEIFEGRGGIFGLDLDNWLTAESEIVWKPPIELREKNNEVMLSVAVPGVEPKQIQIEATPEDLVVKAELHHEHREDKGSIHSCEFQRGSMFRTIHFPKRINPDKMKAEFKNGMLSIHAPLAEEQRVRTVPVEAA